jgi:6-phosphofructokinase 2
VTKGIVTLTLNPALDVSVEVDRITPGMKLRTGAPRIEPGGGGINAARAIVHLGGEATALFVAGGEFGRRLKRLVDAEGVRGRALQVDGETRESFTAFDRSTGEQFRFVLPGPALSASDARRCVEAVGQASAGGGYVIASGSLPPGVPGDFYADVVRTAHAAGAVTVLDGPGAALAPALEAQPYLIKPNWREFDELIGNDAEDDTERERAAERIVRDGGAEVVVVTLGAEGSRVTTREGHVRLHPPHVHPVSAVGAGDSFAGAMTLALSRGRGLIEACRYGVAAASATQIAPGTALCRLEDTERFYAEVTAEPQLGIGAEEEV